MCSFFFVYTRYFYICYKHWEAKMFSKTCIFVYCLSTWLISIALCEGVFIYIGLNKYNDHLRGCFVHHTFNKYLFSSFVTLGAIIPCLFIFYFYLSIFTYIYKAILKARSLDHVRN